MGFDGDAIRELIDAVKPCSLNINGKTYSSVPVHNPPDPKHYDFPTLSVGTLAAICEYVKANRDELKKEGMQIGVDAQKVVLLGPPAGEMRRRDLYMLAIFSNGQSGNVEGNFEEVRIKLLTQFYKNDALDNVLKFLANIVDEKSIQSEDDGVSQSVTTKAGIASRAQTTVPSPVLLMPMRTFSEVRKPPQVPFVFRLQGATTTQPMRALLLEAHSDWKWQAIEEIKSWLRERPELEGVPIIG